MRVLAAFAFAVTLVCLGVGPGHAEKRVALLIGNRDYRPGVGVLANPLNDIRVVGDALRSVGFEVLKPVQNATRTEMLGAIYAFAAALRAAGPDAVGFLYYSGHGIASAGENYLIPVDVAEPSTVQLSILGVRQSEVLAILRSEAPNAAHYLVLDACRNTLQGARGGKGFVPVGQQSGVLVAFATEPGKTASDTGAGSGPYAAALAAELARPGQNDLLMFHNVRVAVIDKTNGDQVPWTEDGIQRPERPVFAAAAPAQPVPTSQAPAPAVSEAAQAWAAGVSVTTSVAVLEDFVRRYGDTIYGTLARDRIDELKKKQTPAAVAPPIQPAAPMTAARLTPAASAAPAQRPMPPPQQQQVAVIAPPAAGAGRRIALVIGNSDYKAVPALPSPRRDAPAVAAAFRGVGFQVTLEGDLSRDAFGNVLRAFGAAAEKADWAVIYFAGHGIEVGGVNYLIPIDAHLATDRDAPFEAVPLDQVLAAVEGARKIRLVLLDCCRENPFKIRTTISRGVGRGLGRVEPDDTLAVYAAKDGQTVVDGVGQNSPFATALLKRIATPGLEITSLFRAVRDDVLVATDRKQEPYTYGSLPAEAFYFAGK